MARKDLLVAIEAKLNTISGLLVKFGPLAIEEPVKPLVAIVPEVNDPTRSKTDKAQNLTLVLRLLTTTAAELDDWTPLLFAAMTEDRKWAGLASDTVLQQERWLFHDPVFPQTGIDQRYLVTY